MSINEMVIIEREASSNIIHSQRFPYHLTQR